jgi:hypothetical protein
MKSSIMITSAMMLALAVMLSATSSPPLFAAGSGSCGKGKVWDPDTQRCVKKPRGSGTGSHAG